MIVTVLFWFLLTSVAYLYGSAALTWIYRVLRLDAIESNRLPVVLLVGLIVLSTLAMIANLLIPLSAGYMAVLLLGGAVLAFQKQLHVPVRFRLEHPLVWFVVILAFLLVLENSTHSPANPDTGLYHAQTIRWFETYRIVPGLGNLQERFAFNSVWLVLNASLSFAFLGLRSFHLAGSFLFLIAILYFAEGLNDLARNQITTASLLKVLFLPLGFYLLGSEISSAGNDMPVTLLIWMAVTLWIEKIDSPSNSTGNTIVIFLIAVFSVTVKLSSALILLLALFIVIEYALQHEWRKVLLLGMIGSLVLVPWMVRSVILSGYLVFPVGIIDIFQVDWKIPYQLLEATVNGVVGFARLPGVDFITAIDMPLQQWVPIWFEKETFNQRTIYGFVLISPVILLLKWRASRKYLLAYITVFAGSIFWFFAAPNIRFGHGFLIATCVLVVAPFALTMLRRIDRDLRIFPSVVFLVLIIFHSYILWRSFETSTISGRWLLPADYRSTGAEPCAIKNATIYCRKEGAQCQYGIFPCIPFIRPDVEMRSESFQDGFRYPPGFGQ